MNPSKGKLEAASFFAIKIPRQAVCHQHIGVKQKSNKLLHVESDFCQELKNAMTNDVCEEGNKLKKVHKKEQISEIEKKRFTKTNLKEHLRQVSYLKVKKYQK